MNWTTTLPFILDNVDGDLKITYNPWGQKFYQNGQEIKRTGSVFGGQKYKVETTDGRDNIVSVKGTPKNGRQIVFRGETIIANTLRGEKDSIKQLIYSIVIAVAATVLFIALALIFGIIIGLIFGVAFSSF